MNSFSAFSGSSAADAADTPARTMNIAMKYSLMAEFLDGRSTPSAILIPDPATAMRSNRLQATIAPSDGAINPPVSSRKPQWSAGLRPGMIAACERTREPR